jgi:muramoyltetrapeptide carboxypeptidase
MQWLLAPALKADDEVAVVLPSSAVRDRGALARGMERLRAWGLRPTVLGSGAPDRGLDWPEGSELAADDHARLAALHEALREPRFRGVFCARGGYGAPRLLTDVDWGLLARDPKPLVGYSDISALLCGAAVGAGVVTFHGPMVATTAAMDAGDACWEQQRRLLFDRGPAALPGADGGRAVRQGVAEGPLLGGNLAVLQGLIGTPWLPELDGALLFLEDIDEAPYRVDRMLTHLRLSGLLDHVAGVVLGDFHVAGAALASEHPPMHRVLAERLCDLEVPVACGFPFGHRPGAWTLPFGGRARLEVDAAGAQLTLLQGCVR